MTVRGPGRTLSPYLSLISLISLLHSHLHSHRRCNVHVTMSPTRHTILAECSVSFRERKSPRGSHSRAHARTPESCTKR